MGTTSYRWIGVTLLCLLCEASSIKSQPCKIPEYLRGRFYSTDRTTELNTVISESSFANEQLGQAECRWLEIMKGTTDAFNRSDIRVVFYNSKSDCYLCQELYLRTLNVVQNRFTSCIGADKFLPSSSTENPLKGLCQEIHPSMDFNTMFRIDVQTINCKNTIQGCYHFTYEVDFGGGSICDSPQNVITACQRPGSVYVDNQVFDMNFGECPDVAGSSKAKIRFQCMGTWEDVDGNIFSALADLGAVHFRNRFRCLLTRNDQKIEDNMRRYSMSRWASCAALKTPYDGDIRLILTPSLYEEIPPVSAGCRFPRNYTGFYMGHHDLDSEVTINVTHLWVRTFLNNYDLVDTYNVCLQNADTRYFTFQIDVGKCETHFVCFDFMPRRQNIIQFRQARSLPVLLSRLNDPRYLEAKFREACSWSRFTLENSKDPLEWIYSTLVGGRYTFVQEGEEDELYKTEVGGMTERPRHSVDCRDVQSELKSCDSNPTKMTIDVSYCASMDHTGRPIGEYDVPDRELVCVAFWMENMKSYLITYDLLDAVSDLRCWVYTRTAWRDITMSRSTSYVCEMGQTAESLGVEESSSLRMVLKEGERIHDECPQRFDTGEGPNSSPLEIFIFDTSSSSSARAIFRPSTFIPLMFFVAGARTFT